MEQFDEKRLENFADKSLDEKYQIVMDMPLTLQLELLGDAGIFKDEHSTISHKCLLKKYKDIDSKQWTCSRKNKEGKKIIVYLNDERNGIAAARTMADRGHENTFLLTGGIEKFIEDYASLIEGNNIPQLVNQG